MKLWLYHRGLVRRLKRAANQRLRREGKNRATGKWWKGGGTGGRYFWVLWLLLNLARLERGASGGGWKVELLSGLSLVMAGVTLSSARKLAEKLTIGPERSVLWFYPIAERDFFEWTMQRFALRSLWVIIPTVVVYVLSISFTGAAGWALLSAAALAEWLVVLCGAWALVRHVDAVPRWLPLSLYVVAGIVLIVPGEFAVNARPLASALPTGWLAMLMTSRWTSRWAIWIVLQTLVGLGFLCGWLWKQLDRVYGRELESATVEEEVSARITVPDIVDRVAVEQAQFAEDLQDEAPPDGLVEATLPVQAAWQKHRLQKWGSAVGEIVRQTEWLRLWDWNAMRPIEKVVGWCLNKREKGEVQFLLGPGPLAWSNRWRTAAIGTAVGTAGMLPGNSELKILAVLAFAVAIAVGLPILGGAWAATNQGRISGKLSPIFSCYPLSYWSAGWTMFKANAVRTAVWMPLGLMIGVSNARSAHTTLGESCWLMGRAILAFITVMPILLAGKFSKVTNDTANLRIATVPLILLFLVVVTVLLLLGAGVFMAGGWWPIIFLAAVALVSWGAWAAYGWYYERGRVDLLREQS